jgi:hypothetical protein
MTSDERIRVTGRRRQQRRPRRARAAALAAALATLAGTGEAVAGEVLVPELGASENAGAVLEQAVEQVGDTLQDAGAGAAAVQEGATNLAAPTVEASSGAETVVSAANEATADSEAANGAVTTQVAGQSQQGGPVPDPKPAPQDSAPQDPATPAQPGQPPAPVSQPPQAGQTATQGSATTQAAGAQATAVQTNPVNVAVPIVIASPGANTVVIQTNSASAAAQATNTAATTQAAGQSQSGGQPAAGAPQGQPPPQTGLPGSGAGGSEIDLVLDSVVQTGSTTWIWIWDWTWNWDWDWSAGEIDLPSVPALQPVPGWTSPADDASSVRAPEPASGSRNGVDGVRAAPLVPATGPAYESLPPSPLASASREGRRSANPSSIFVQPDAKPAPGRLFLPPIGRHAAPGGSAGAGIAPLTLVVGALLALALQIFSAAGLLGRRFAHTAVGWRRQAYLTPLERPG